MRCFFIGQRDAPSDVYDALCMAVEKHILLHGVTEFLVGGYGAFDRMAAKAVMEAKKKYAQITLLRLWAYLPTGDTRLPSGFDGSIFPEGLEKTPPPYAIVKANQLAVDSASFLIAYTENTMGNSIKIVRRAQRKGVAVTLLST